MINSPTFWWNSTLLELDVSSSNIVWSDVNPFGVVNMQKFWTDLDIWRDSIWKKISAWTSDQDLMLLNGYYNQLVSLRKKFLSKNDYVWLSKIDPVIDALCHIDSSIDFISLWYLMQIILKQDGIIEFFQYLDSKRNQNCISLLQQFWNYFRQILLKIL